MIRARPGSSSPTANLGRWLAAAAEPEERTAAASAVVLVRKRPKSSRLLVNAAWGSWLTTSKERLTRSEEHTSELQSLRHAVCRLLLEKKKNINHEAGRQVPASCCLGPLLRYHRP